jgi:autotransporter-associated beta strand protein
VNAATNTANITFTWNPGNAITNGDTSAMGGDGIWNYTAQWWNTTDGNIAIGNASNSPIRLLPANQNLVFGNTLSTVGYFGSTTAHASLPDRDTLIAPEGLGSILNFNGDGGVIYRQFAAYFAEGSNDNIITHTLNFAQGAWTITNNPGIGSTRTFSTRAETTGGNAAFVFHVGSGASLNLFSSGYNATLTNPIGIQTAFNISGSNAIAFDGPGSITLGNNVYVRNESVNSRVAATNGVTLNFSTGSFLSGAMTGLTSAAQQLGTAALDPFFGTAVPANGGSPVTLVYRTRLAVLSGSTVNINGGSLYLGYRGSATSGSVAGYGLLIGDPSGSGAVNLSSGNLSAIGDPRSTSAANAGISFSAASGSLGGSFIQTGGSLYVSNFRADTSVPTALLTFNGGSVIVSTETTPNGSQTAPTDEQLQSRLDSFISGFAGNATNHVALGSAGLNLDTSALDTSRTNGVVTISSALRDLSGQAGTLSLNGPNTLKLTAVNTFTGAVHVNDTATFLNTGSLAAPTFVAASATLAGNGSFGDITFDGATGTLLATPGLTAANVTFGFTLNITLDVSGGLSGAALTFASLNASGSTVHLTLANANDPELAGGILLQVLGSTNLSSNNFNLTGTALNWSFQNGVLALQAIPEPATTALLLALLALAALFWVHTKTTKGITKSPNL